ncbi:MAG: ABC transporter ATP-binding protein [Kiritimatiellia bacterium]
MPKLENNLLEIDALQVHYGPVCAVNGVSINIGAGECVALVGESGCGKTSLSRAVVGLEKISGGRLLFDGKNISDYDADDWKKYRGRVQMIFQDPAESLNPRITVGGALNEVLKVCRRMPAAERLKETESLLKTVGLDADLAVRYPHELSGGQKQRVGIARALAVNPDLIIADEPVSALDVSVQVQILNLLLDLQQARGMALLLIAHDLAVVRYMCRRIYIMNRGEIMESGTADQIFENPSHPYTRALLDAVPDVDRGRD